MKIPFFLLPLVLLSCTDKKNTEHNNPAGSTIVASAATVTTLKDSTLAKEDPATVYRTPGPEHKMLASWNGKWMGEITYHTAGDQSVLKGNSLALNRMILGGRYLVSNQKGILGNMPFEGVNTLAYDNAKNQFLSTWIDNLGTGIVVLQGPWNETTKTINLSGMETDPGSGKEKIIRETLRIIDNDRQVMEIFKPGTDGKEQKIMEVLYTRKSH